MISNTAVVSIIVPVYNVEAYLERCLISLGAQNYTSLEILLIDDGSTDKSGEICLRYSRQDVRFNYTKKENGGLSSARNLGLELATGEFVLFVDSDDFIDTDAVARLVEIMQGENLDILCTNYRVITDNKVSQGLWLKNIYDEVATGEDYLYYTLKNNQYSSIVCDKMYRLEYLNEFGFKFMDGITHEDEHFTPRVMLHARRVKYENMMFYNYVKRENSLSSPPNFNRNYQDILKVVYGLERYVHTNCQAISVRTKQSVLNLLAGIYVNYFAKNIRNIKNVRRDVDYRFLLRNVYKTRTRIKVLLFILAPRIYARLNNHIREG